MMIMSFVFLTIAFMQGFFKKTLKSWGFSFGGRKINVDENLPPFWKALRYSDADWIYQEHKYLRRNYQTGMIDAYAMKQLDESGIAKKTIVGVPYYFILANPRYFQDFQYICCNVPNRENLIVDDDENEGNDQEQSDMVSIVLNLAFFPDDAANQFKFAAGFSKPFVEAIKKIEVKKVDESEKEDDEAEDAAPSGIGGLGGKASLMKKMLAGAQIP